MEGIKIRLTEAICKLIEQSWNEEWFEELQENLIFEGDGVYLITPKVDVLGDFVFHEFKPEVLACRA